MCVCRVRFFLNIGRNLIFKEFHRVYICIAYLSNAITIVLELLIFIRNLKRRKTRVVRISFFSPLNRILHVHLEYFAKKFASICVNDIFILNFEHSTSAAPWFNVLHIFQNTKNDFKFGQTFNETFNGHLIDLIRSIEWIESFFNSITLYGKRFCRERETERGTEKTEFELLFKRKKTKQKKFPKYNWIDVRSDGQITHAVFDIFRSRGRGCVRERERE